MGTSCGMSRLRSREGRASKSRLRGQFDKAFIPTQWRRCALVPQGRVRCTMRAMAIVSRTSPICRAGSSRFSLTREVRATDSCCSGKTSGLWSSQRRVRRWSALGGCVPFRGAYRQSNLQLIRSPARIFTTRALLLCAGSTRYLIEGHVPALAKGDRDI
jgi:hypothetical protein